MESPDGLGGTKVQFTPAEIAEMESILKRHNSSTPTQEVHETLAEKFSFVRKSCGQGNVLAMQVEEWFRGNQSAIVAKDIEKSKESSVLTSPTFQFEEQDDNGPRRDMLHICGGRASGSRGGQGTRGRNCVHRSSRPRWHEKGQQASETDVEDLSSMNHPGPIDASVLISQQTHRSTLIWGGESDRTFEVRHHRMWELHERVAPYVARAGFFAWTKMHNIQIDWPLITALIERWRSETHTFHFREGEMTVTLQDVGLLSGLPVDGIAVTGNDHNDDWTTMCVALLGRDPERGRSPYVVHLSWFAKNMQTPPDNADEIVLEQFARAYILCMFASSLFTDTSGNAVSLHYLPLLQDLSVTHTYSWGSAVLAYLYRQLCSACFGRHRQVGGAVVLLQFWAWERIALSRPRQRGLLIPDAVNPSEDVIEDPMMLPSITYGMWEGTRAYAQTPRQVLLFYRDQLDHQRLGDLTWTPYKEHRFQGINPICMQGRHIWTAEVPLVCFNIVEWHYPSRVLRQFGWQPMIPGRPREGHTELHKVNRRKGKLDWSVEHARWIALWDRREQFVVDGSINYDHEAHRKYTDWYQKITRRIIQPPAFQVSAYQPTGPERHDLVKALVRSCKAAADIFLSDADEAKKIAHDLFHSCWRDLNDLNESVCLKNALSQVHLPRVSPPSSGGGVCYSALPDEAPESDEEDDSNQGNDIMSRSQMTQATQTQVHKGEVRKFKRPKKITDFCMLDQ